MHVRMDDLDRNAARRTSCHRSISQSTRTHGTAITTTGMQSRDSSTTRSSAPDFSPYFPRATAPQSVLGSTTLPLRPQSVGPVFDKSLARTPISGFNDVVHSTSYSPRPDGVEADLPPSQPNDFVDEYLMPSLTRNERLRLTMFWYYTRDILKDEDFLRRLREKLELVQVLVGWEFAIVGLLSEDVYTRLVTVGLPLAILPRRESTCSHTINQKPGTVFMLPDMDSDWRFKKSPHVAYGGLRTYAGAQLRCKALNGEEIALGSICVASNSKQANLSAVQQSVLVRFADVIASELVNHSGEARKQQRHFMAQLLAECQAKGNDEGCLLDIIRQVYPGASIDIQVSTDGLIYFPNHSPIHFDDLEGGLWEDVEAIENLILTGNHTKLETSQTIRAIAHPCLTHLGTRYLVVASNQVQNVFDDVDSWFIESCAAQMRHIIQESHLEEALKAKEMFMRGITHQLRTPIHGVLVSCELLSEELTKLKLVDNAPVNPATDRTVSAVNTIRDSATELMSTINNILKLSRWANNIQPPTPVPLRALKDMEIDILYETQQLIPDQDLGKVSILFENRLPTDNCTLEIDISLLKECIQALVFNALLYTNEGAVVVVIRAPADYSSLVFDVFDTGIGIAEADQKRIFESYEKVDSHGRGAGLGLTLAQKIAAAMDGSVSLVSSSQQEGENGSHFRAEFHSPRFSIPPQEQTTTPDHEIPPPDPVRTCHVLLDMGGQPKLLSHFLSYLEHQGYQIGDDPQAAVVVIPFTTDDVELQRLLESLERGQVAICLVPAGETHTNPSNNSTVLFFSGPFLSSRLEGMLGEMTKACQVARSGTMAHMSNTTPVPHDGTPEPGNSAPPTHSIPVALLVDDNMINLRIARMYCEKRKIQYVTAMDGQEAVVKFKESLDKPGEAINLILMDLQMPVCDGIEATLQIRTIEKENSLIPSHIFMVTGQDSALDKSRSFEAGADKFYVKPMSLKVLDRGIGGRFPNFRQSVSSQDQKKMKS